MATFPRFARKPRANCKTCGVPCSRPTSRYCSHACYASALRKPLPESIRAEYFAGASTIKLAKKYGVSHPTIVARIKAGRMARALNSSLLLVLAMVTFAAQGCAPEMHNIHGVEFEIDAGATVLEKEIALLLRLYIPRAAEAMEVGEDSIRHDMEHNLIVHARSGSTVDCGFWQGDRPGCTGRGDIVYATGNYCNGLAVLSHELAHWVAELYEDNPDRNHQDPRLFGPTGLHARTLVGVNAYCQNF